MFSLVLMTAVAGGPDVAASGSVYGGCYGSACYGASCSGCYGSSCSGCFGSCSGCYGSCSGCYGSCYGGPAFPCVRAVIAAPFRLIGGVFHALSCHGSCSGSCYGSCYGSGCTGSSCYGSSCFGCTGCSGCYGSSVYGGCYGSLAASPAAVYGGCYGSGCFGCHGGGCYGGGAITGADVSVPSVDGLTLAGTATSMSAKLVESAAPATLTVHLPAGATLSVDGAAVPGDGPIRRFHTPELAPGKTFYYELRAELTVNGKAQPEEMKVLVRAGETREVRFDKLLAAVSAAAAADTGTLARK